MAKWQRPASVPFPSVWHRFEGKKEVNGVLPKYWVQDIPEDLYETAVELMCKHFAKDEITCRCAKVADDPELMQTLRQMWEDCLKARLGIVCFMENPDPNGKPIVAGFNFTTLNTKNDKLPKYPCKKIYALINVLVELNKVKNPFEAFGVNEYMGAFGLLVLPEFRGQGLGVEILKARIPLMKAVGLKVTLTHFSWAPSQKSAERAGFKVLTELTYEELERRDPLIHYPDIEKYSKSMKYMYKWAE